jgi:small conductance mechanosensitive channel
MGLSYGPRVLGAALVWFVGRMLIRMINRVFNNMLERREIEPSLKPFLKSLVRGILLTLVVISVLSTLGVEMTSFIALLGAVGLAIGMALSGTLQNFAGGVIILLLKPFKVNDFLEAQGFTGTVKEILIFNTILLTPDNRTVIIPNGPLSSGPMINYTRQVQRRVDFTFGIGYGDSTEKARKVISEIIDSDQRILKDPAPFIEVLTLGASSVDLAVRVWVKTDDYWAVFFSMQDSVYNEFNRTGLNIPYPQMDVHLHQKK